MFEKYVEKVKNSFVAFDYKTSIELLKRLQGGNVADKTLILFVGANGSGKSTFIANLVKFAEFKYKYVNADLVQLNENTDAYASMLKTMDIVNDLIDLGKSFAYETVFSHISKLELAEKAKEKGYKIISVYVSTKSVDINIRRVKKRASQGGHDVDENKIAQRYERTKENVKILRGLSDEFYEFDNSKEL